MKPKPFVALNHFTVPVAIAAFPLFLTGSPYHARTRSASRASRVPLGQRFSKCPGMLGRLNVLDSSRRTTGAPLDLWRHRLTAHFSSAGADLSLICIAPDHGPPLRVFARISSAAPQHATTRPMSNHFLSSVMKLPAM